MVRRSPPSHWLRQKRFPGFLPHQSHLASPRHSEASATSVANARRRSGTRLPTLVLPLSWSSASSTETSLSHGCTSTLNPRRPGRRFGTGCHSSWAGLQRRRSKGCFRSTRAHGVPTSSWGPPPDEALQLAVARVGPTGACQPGAFRVPWRWRRAAARGRAPIRWATARDALSEGGPRLHRGRHVEVDASERADLVLIEPKPSRGQQGPDVANYIPGQLPQLGEPRSEGVLVARVGYVE